MKDREELEKILDRHGIDGEILEGLPEAILAWHTARLNEARIDLLERVRSEQIPVMAMLDNKGKDWVGIQAIPLSALQRIEEEL